MRAPADVFTVARRMSTLAWLWLPPPPVIEISGGVSGDSRMKWLRMNSALISLPLGSSSAPRPASRVTLEFASPNVSDSDLTLSRFPTAGVSHADAPKPAKFTPLFLNTLPLM